MYLITSFNPIEH